ncbi:MAG: methyltransferase domain-containing protein, partial [Proteobacteria bacterium]|nr:methyltransferase domain-containing protein [Pseudomonadota bacterium]
MKIFNKQQIAKSFNHAALTYDASAVLQREIGKRSIERLDLVKIQPEMILDLGTFTFYFSNQLKKQSLKSQVIDFDIAEKMLQHAKHKSPWWHKPKYICGDAERLPFQAQSFDLIFSNLYMQWCDDLP